MAVVDVTPRLVLPVGFDLVKAQIEVLVQFVELLVLTLFHLSAELVLVVMLVAVLIALLLAASVELSIAFPEKLPSQLIEADQI